jgi:hypothetical protein
MRGTQLYSIVHLILLNSRFEISEEEKHEIPQDDIRNLTQTVESNGDKFTIAYKRVEEKFKPYVRDFTGTTLNTIMEEECSGAPSKTVCSESKRVEEAKAAVCAQVEEEMGLNVTSVKTFLPDLTKYRIALSPNAVALNKQIFIFTGNGWIQKTALTESDGGENVSVPLGSKFVLDKASHLSSLKLYMQGSDGKRQGNSLLDLQILHFNQAVILYPTYLAYQKEKDSIGIVEFSEDGSSINKVCILPKGIYQKNICMSIIKCFTCLYYN